MDTPERSSRELDVLFDRSPIALVFGDRELRARRTNANARLGLLERAGSQIGTTLDIRRTAEELAALAVPDLADRVAVDLCDPVLQGEDPGQDPAPAQAPCSFAGWRCATPQPGPRSTSSRVT